MDAPHFLRCNGGFLTLKDLKHANHQQTQKVFYS